MQDLIGKRDEDLFPPQIAQSYSADDRSVIESGSALHSIEPSIDRQGRTGWIERIKSPIFSRDGSIIGVQLMFWDVTDKVHAEMQLKHERDLLNHLLRHIPDSIYFKDRESRFLRISEAMAKKFGMPNAASVEGKTDADIFSEEHARGLGKMRSRSWSRVSLWSIGSKERLGTVAKTLGACLPRCPLSTTTGKSLGPSVFLVISPT